MEARIECLASCRWHLQIHFHYKKCGILIQISLTFVPRDSIKDTAAFLHIMTWPLFDMTHTVLQRTHWDQVTHICVSELTIIGSDKGLSPGRRQAIIWTNTGILLIEPIGTNVSEISIRIYTFSFKKMHLNMSSVTWRPFCLGLNVLKRSRRGTCLCLC